MKSRFHHLKEKSIELRRSGASIKDIRNELGIPLSTLSGWLKHVELTAPQQARLDANWRAALGKARVGAIKWHNNERLKRIEEAQSAGEKVLIKINVEDKTSLELALAMLYLGEGFKKNKFGLGNSDSRILKFFLVTISHLYGINPQKVSLALHLRADQDPEEMKKFWSKELTVSPEQFQKASIDKRTLGRATYPEYKGVCLINCGNVAIQRKLVYLGKAFCEKVISAHSSIGRAFD